ncbi:MAG: SRPBCC family protein [Candidatus Sumerlaeia bacterium]|nr:SRPBCC family protein [Candidatus Sumerlaeia bacterium]
MPAFETEHRIDAPPPAVYAALIDIPGSPSRIPAIKSVEMLTPGECGVGTKWREKRIMFGKEATEVLELTALEPDRLVEVGCESHGMRYRTAFELSPDGAGTRVVLRFEATPLTAAAKAMALLAGAMVGMMKKAMEEDLKAIGKSLAAG